MTTKPKKIGRPSTVGPGAEYRTVKLRRDQLKALNRLSGPIPGRMPDTIRTVIDAGLLKLARSRTARC